MRYISRGDFTFPFTAGYYALKQFYVWSFQTGAANLDGVIRMPARLIYLAVFALFGNLAFSYFYLFSTVLVCFLSFYFFATRVLLIDKRRPVIVASLFFAVNPIFLANISKTGLILAAGMLPLCMVFARAAALEQKLTSYIVWLFCLNVSLIHPFNFTVNAVVSGSYFAALLIRRGGLRALGKIIPGLVVVGFLALLINAYFVLPVISMRTVSKGALSDTISSRQVDYTALVDTLNTGNVYTGLSLSKNVLLDYDFYSANTKTFYFLGIYTFYLLLLGGFVLFEKRFSKNAKRAFAVCLVAFLLLIALATVNFLNVSAVIKTLIQLPFGWAFRSPLKWQLYIPLTLFTMLVIVLLHIPEGKPRKIFYSALALSFIAMNAYLVGDVYNKLLTPQVVNRFASLQNITFTHNNALYVGSNDCFNYERAHTAVMNEFNEIMTSKDVQLKRATQADAAKLNIDSFDYVFSCQGSAKQLISGYDFKKAHVFVSGALELYCNTSKKPFVFATDSLLATSLDRLEKKYEFTRQQTADSFNVVDAEAAANSHLPLTQIDGVFDALSPQALGKNGVIERPVGRMENGGSLYNLDYAKPLYFNVSNDVMTLSPSSKPGYSSFPAAKKVSYVDVPKTVSKLVYQDTTYEFANSLKNPSFEDGLWQKKVSDCYAYDNQPRLGMDLDSSRKTNGKNSLLLKAGRHIACTGPTPIRVSAGQEYLLSFDYLVKGGPYAGYSLSFDDPDHTIISDRLGSKKQQAWQVSNRQFSVPEGAKNLTIKVYAYPHGGVLTSPTQVNYDNFSLQTLPQVQNRFYLVARPSQHLEKPEGVSYVTKNPTQTDIDIKKAKAPFYLHIRDTYSGLWQLKLKTNSQSRDIQNTNHIKTNGFMQGWYIDPTVLCASTSNACERNRDGSYNLALIAEFKPQKWFAVGAAVSGVSIVGCIAFIIYSSWRSKVKAQRGQHARR